MNIKVRKINFRKLKLDSISILIFLYSCMPIVDSLNGYILLQLNRSFSLGQAYRFVLLALLFGIAFTKGVSLKRISLHIELIIVFAILSCFHILLYGKFGGEMAYLFQWMFIPLLLLGFIELKETGMIDQKTIAQVLDAYSWIVPATIFVPYILGIGFNTYAGDIGYKGFYYANNGVSFISSVLIIYSLCKLFVNLSFSGVVNSLLLFATCLMLGTKASAVAIIVALVFVLILSFKKNVLRGLLTTLLMVVVIIITYIFFERYISEKIMGLINRYNYMQTIYSKTFMDQVTSGRIIKINGLFQSMKTSSVYPWGYIWGMGDSGMVAEMDFLDLFFGYGIIGFMSLGIYIYKLFNVIHNRFSIYSLLLAFAVLYSAIVGHVFNNSMSSMVFVLILVAMDIRKPIIQENVAAVQLVVTKEVLEEK